MPDIKMVVFNLENFLGLRATAINQRVGSNFASNITSTKKYNMTDTRLKCAEAQMLIRKPVAEVFEAFVDPATTKKFWFTKGSGKLEAGKSVTWEWEMYNTTWTVTAKQLLKNKKIILDESPSPTTIEFDFKALSDSSTYISVKQYGFTETEDELVEKIKGATGGWTTVLDGAKIFLEHGINPNFVADKFPKEVSKHGQ